MANALPLRHRKLVNPPPFPGGRPSGIHLILPLEQEMDAAQTLGLIKGLTSVIQEQSNAMKATNDQIQHLSGYYC